MNNTANNSDSTGERKDFEVYSCDISPDGSRLVTAAGGEFCSALPTPGKMKGKDTDTCYVTARWICPDMVHRGYQ